MEASLYEWQTKVCFSCGWSGDESQLVPSHFLPGDPEGECCPSCGSADVGDVEEEIWPSI